MNSKTTFCFVGVVALGLNTTGQSHRGSLPLTQPTNSTKPANGVDKTPLRLSSDGRLSAKPSVSSASTSAFSYSHGPGFGFTYGMATAEVITHGEPQTQTNNSAYPSWSDRNKSDQTQSTQAIPPNRQQNYVFDDGESIVRIFVTPRQVRVRVKPKAAGKEKVFTAKDLIELRDKQPEAFALYRKHVLTDSKPPALAAIGDEADANQLLQHQLKALQQNGAQPPAIQLVLEKMQHELKAAATNQCEPRAVDMQADIAKKKDAK